MANTSAAYAQINSDIKLSGERRPLFLDELTEAELHAGLKKGLDSIERGHANHG